MTEKLPRDMTENELRYHCAALGAEIERLTAENENLRAILKNCMPGTASIDLGGGEVVGLYQQSAACATCNDDPIECARIAMRHCEKLQRE